MYKIGDFSKLVDIPVRTLRYYAEYGVLIPSNVDKFTGYKYYSEENVIECELIKVLKMLDFTLNEIKEYKNIIDEEILEKKKKEIKDKIYLLELKYKRLTLIQEELKNSEKYSIFNEIENNKILRRKYEKRNVEKND